MKHILSLLKPNVIRAIIFSGIAKLMLALASIFVWHYFVNLNSLRPYGIVDTGFFALGLWFAIGAWIQYLSLDGMRPFKALHIRKNKSLNAWEEEELEEDELITVKLCSNLLLAVIFFVPSLIASLL